MVAYVFTCALSLLTIFSVVILMIALFLSKFKLSDLLGSLYGFLHTYVILRDLLHIAA